MRRAALLGALALAGCASVSEQTSEDARSLAAEVQERVGADLPLEAGTQQLAAEVRELLASPLDEASALRIALVRNPRVRAALEELGVASAALVQAGLLPNPAFSAEARSFGSGWELEFWLAQPITDLLFLSARKRIAASEHEATRARIAGRLVELSFDVRRALVRVRAAERLLALERASAAAAGAARDLMRELHEAGNVTDPLLTEAELTVARAKQAVAAAEAMLVEAREPLAFLLALGRETPEWTVTGGLPEDPDPVPPIEETELNSIRISLDLAASRATAGAAARAVGISDGESLLQGLELGVAAKRDHEGGDWGVGPALGGTLPLWDFGGTRRSAAEARARQALAEHEALALEVGSAARVLHTRCRTLAERALIARDEELLFAQRWVTETLRNYNAMQIGAFEVLLVRRQELEAMRRHVLLLRDAWLARADLGELLAGRLNRARLLAGGDAPASRDSSMARGGHE